MSYFCLPIKICIKDLYILRRLSKSKYSLLCAMFFRHIYLILVLLFIHSPASVCLLPPARDYAAAYATKDLIWVFGGYNIPAGYISSLYSLNISSSWPTTSPPWTDHSNDAKSGLATPRAY